MSDGELYQRADVVVHGIVVSSGVTEDDLGRPETVTFIEPLSVLKGSLSGSLILHQLGGTLPDGRFFQLFGRPEYHVGREVVVFAISRTEGDFQTAEMLLGKFEVWEDAAARRFAVPDLAIGYHEGVSVRRPPRLEVEDSETEHFTPSPRELPAFLTFVSSGASSPLGQSVVPEGELRPVVHEVDTSRKIPLWGNIGDNLWRWNPPTAVWTLDGTANMTGGGIAEAQGALASWTNDPNSSINFTTGAGSPNLMHLNAMSSPCGWTTCLSGAGVIGCGGPRGGGTHTWRGESYLTITGGEVWLRSYCAFNGFSSTITESVLLHESGHALGLGHSNQNFSPHDVCAGDESAATMFSTVQNRRTLGTDDRDAIRWIYGDGGNSCTSLPAPTVASIGPLTGTSAGGTPVTITGTNYQAGAAVSIGGVSATVTAVTPTSISATTGAHAVASADVVVTNPDTQTATLTNGYFYDFLDVPASHPFHDFVVRIFRNGITSGCGGNNYCPDSSVPRDQMAVFLLRGEHGGSYVPPPATGTVFNDVPTTAFAADFIERLSAEGITSGCSVSPPLYCPGSLVTRAQMAVFLLRARLGSAYVPPAATGTVFGDVPAGAFAAAWIEDLAARGITSGCGGGNYCPNDPNTRGQMSVFLVRTFNLP